MVMQGFRFARIDQALQSPGLRLYICLTLWYGLIKTIYNHSFSLTIHTKNKILSDFILNQTVFYFLYEYLITNTGYQTGHIFCMIWNFS